jgi:hypothetical protein
MPLPGRLNITIYQGDDFDRDFLVEEIVDDEQVPVDFTNHEIRALVRTHQSAPRVIGVFDINWPSDGEDQEDRLSGTFNASLNSSTTARLPRSCVYDIQSTDVFTGKTKTWVYGRIRVIKQVTRD